MAKARRSAIQFGTIIAGNYLPYARVLAASLAVWHPGARLQCLVIDDREGRDRGGEPSFDVLHLADLVREPGELERMAMCYDVMELATAVKPWLLRHLLERGAAVAVHLDPDILCFAELDEVEALARGHGIVLTPHTTEPVPRDGRKPTEADLMETGTYNLGFVAVSPAAAPFLSWWQVRLRRDAIVDPKAMLFTDQRWVDLVPGYFPVHVLRDPGYNVAYWNLGTRTIEPAGDGYTVGGRPLRFLHFSGYDPDRPHLLSRHQGERPRVLLSEHPVLRRLCDDYRRRLLLAGYGDPDLPRYGYGRVPGGPPIDRLMRRLYRVALLASEDGGRPEPPNPFRPGEAQAFCAWLREPVGGPGSRLTRYLDFLYHDRIDLQVAFNDVPGPGTEWFLGWARDHGVSEEDLPVELVPPPLEAAPADSDAASLRRRAASSRAPRPGTAAAATWHAFAPPGRRRAAPARRVPPTDVGGGATGPDDPVQVEADGAVVATDRGPGRSSAPTVRRLPEGVNVAGYLEADLGLGTAARAVLRAIERSGSAVATVVYRDTQSRQSRPFAALVEGEAPYDCSLVCINGDLLGNFARDAGAGFFEDRYTIAQWHWETETFPASMRAGLGWVDEIWVASRFEQQAMERETDKPVVVFPMPVVDDEAAAPLALPREALGLPQGFLFLFCFDFLSVMERKNPVGLVEAFGRAFPPGSGSHLVIKSINGERRPNERERLRLAAAAHTDVRLLESYLSGSEVQALTATCDCYVSLHRSEGFGLTLADAMAAGKPVIATRYSGNLEFMSDETGYLVDCTLVPVGDSGAPYPPSHRWAEPDLDDAARLMRLVVADPEAARARAALGRAALRRRFTTAACAAFAAERLAVIRAARALALPREPLGWLDADGTRLPAPQEPAPAEPDPPEPDPGEPAPPDRSEADGPAAPGNPETAAAESWPVGAGPVEEGELPEVEPEGGRPDTVESGSPEGMGADGPEIPEPDALPPAPAPEPRPDPELPPEPEPAAEDRAAAPAPATSEPTAVPPLPVAEATQRLVASRAVEADLPPRAGLRGWAAALVRRGVDRLLVPYDRRQRAIAEALLTSIREVAGTVPAAADLVHRRVDGAEARRAALGDRLEGLTGQLDRLTGHVDRLTGHVGALDHALGGLRDGLNARIDGVGGRIDGLGGRIDVATAGLGTMTEHLDRLTRHVQGITVLVDQLNGRTEGLEARQGRILLRHDRLASRVDRTEDLVTHLERVERELLRARRAAERLVATAEAGGSLPARGATPAPPTGGPRPRRRAPRRGQGAGPDAS